MALGRIRTQYGHAAGRHHGRWMHREDAKRAARRKRRAEDYAMALAGWIEFASD